MKEITGDIWHFHSEGNFIVISTNGFVKNNGQNVMGRGVALQAAQRFPNLAAELGVKIKEDGNQVYCFREYRIITFPVKHTWFESADIDLIKKSTEQLLKLSQHLAMLNVVTQIYLPLVGCGNGKLLWKDVKPILEEYLDDDFTVVHYE